MTALRSIPTFALALIATLTTACASTSSHYDPNASQQRTGLEPPRRERGSDQILASELATFRGTTLAEAIRQLRPEFLRTSPTRTITGKPALPTVYLDGRPAGGLDVLGTIPLAPVVEIRFVTAMAAKSVYGSYCACDGGVILVRTRAEAPR
jgi:hypothetical protein